MGTRKVFFPRKRRFNAKTVIISILFISIGMISFVAGLHVGAQYMSPEDAVSFLATKTALIDFSQ